jgi:hypothetical protein
VPFSSGVSVSSSSGYVDFDGVARLNVPLTM